MRRRPITWLLRATALVVAAYGLLAGGVAAAMLQPPERFGLIISIRRLSTL